MQKIPTLFDRNWEGNRKVNSTIAIPEFNFEDSIATEKLDGTNVRVTVRNHTVVRLEKRRNPNKAEKKQGVVDPWYVDAHKEDKADQYIFDAVNNTDFSDVPDGEWSAEALGEKIQGNPLNLKGHILFLFSLPNWKEKITFKDAPTSYQELKEWLPKQNSFIGNQCGIEGLVWHNLKTGERCKIKCKDFDFSN